MRTRLYGLIMRCGCAAGLVACQAEPVAPTQPFGPMRVDLHVLDSAGAALPNSQVAAVVWRRLGRTEYRALADSAGGAAWQDTLTQYGPVDSMTASAAAEACGDDPARRTAALGYVYPAIGVATASLTLPSLPRAAFAVGTEYCGPGLGLEIGGAFWVSFVVESATDSLRGHWEIDYRVSRATEFGPMSGVASATELRFELRPDHPLTGCQPHYELVVMLAADGLMRTGRLQSVNGCAVYATPFEITAYANPYFP